MTDLRTAAKQALEAMERPTYDGFEEWLAAMRNARDALRAALKTQSTHSTECYKWHHECAVAEVERLRAALAEPQIEDPAIHFCHRFAILMECMLLTNDINFDRYWDEAHALLGEYHKAQEWWQHQMGEPYVSGFGKD